MARVRGCEFPHDLLYDVPRHVWYRPQAGGLLQLGMTAVGVSLAREVIIFTPKRVGTQIKANKALAVVESAKWAGSMRAGFDAVVEGVNDAQVARAEAVNTDCYGAGWLMLLRPSDDAWAACLVPGHAIAEAYEAWMEDNGFPGCGDS